MQICFHEIKDQIDILVILGFNQLLQADYIWMTIKLSQENNLSESSLSIRGILKSIKNFLNCNNIFIVLIDRFPDYSISPFTKLLKNLELFKNMGLNFLSHLISFRYF